MTNQHRVRKQLVQNRYNNEPTFCSFLNAHKGLACSHHFGKALTNDPRFNPHKILVIVNKIDRITGNHNAIPPVFLVFYMQARLHKRPVLLRCHLHQATVDKIFDLLF
jgi:hypothetical protein